MSALPCSRCGGTVIDVVSMPVFFEPEDEYEREQAFAGWFAVCAGCGSSAQGTRWKDNAIEKWNEMQVVAEDYKLGKHPVSAVEREFDKRVAQQVAVDSAQHVLAGLERALRELKVLVVEAEDARESLKRLLVEMER